MEDFSNILWLLVIAGSVVASVLTKTNKEKNKKSALPEAFPTPATEAWQPENEEENASRHVPATGRSFRPAKSATVPRRKGQETVSDLFPSGREFARPIEAGSSGQAPEDVFATQDDDFASGLPDPITEAEAFAFKSEENAAATADATAGKTVEAPETDLLADFDLRKAVVWSEVLKPKFEEN